MCRKKATKAAAAHPPPPPPAPPVFRSLVQQRARARCWPLYCTKHARACTILFAAKQPDTTDGPHEGPALYSLLLDHPTCTTFSSSKSTSANLMGSALLVVFQDLPPPLRRMQRYTAACGIDPLAFRTCESVHCPKSSASTCSARWWPGWGGGGEKR
jgi:hypothetical protein